MRRLLPNFVQQPRGTRTVLVFDSEMVYSFSFSTRNSANQPKRCQSLLTVHNLPARAAIQLLRTPLYYNGLQAIRAVFATLLRKGVQI